MAMASGEEPPDCMKCRATPSKHKIRTETLCSACFQNWVGVKVSKRTESLRVLYGHPRRKVLLAISFGCCSLSLLIILDRLLEGQRTKTGRVGYELSVIHILGADVHESASSASSKLARLEKMFPSYAFYSLALEEGVTRPMAPPNETDHTSITVDCLQNLSASSHEDLMCIVRNRLIMQRARELECTNVIYGDSTSRLSERILAETAKGRGFALPQLIGDAIPPGEIGTLYPLRDLFRTEIEEYVKTFTPELWELGNASGGISQEGFRTASTRNMTIDRLMAQYVTEMEGNTPNIVASVLRTAAKLRQPPRSHLCPVCGMAMDEGAAGLRGWGGDQAIDLISPEGSTSQVHHNAQLCYGCTRSLGRT